MLGAFQAHLAEQLNEIRHQGLYKTERAISTPQRAHIRTADGQEVLNLCGNNYLGLADHPEVIEAAKVRLHTDLEAAQCAKEQVLGNYKSLLAVEEAFCQLKSYLEVRPVFHQRPDRVRNHVRLCFIAYWLCAVYKLVGDRPTKWHFVDL